jgi:hypothetical protein
MDGQKVRYSPKNRFKNPEFWNYQDVSGFKKNLKLFRNIFQKQKCIDVSSQPRTTDARLGNCLHCTAENQIPIPNL